MVVTPVLVVDDGEHLSPLEADAIRLSSEEWPHAVELVAQAVTAVEARLNREED